MSDTTDNEKALMNIERFFDNTIKRFKSTFKLAAKEVGERLVMNTPLFFDHEPTTGETRGNWDVFQDQEASQFIPSRIDKEGEKTTARLGSSIMRMKIGDQTKIIFANPTPWIADLELGLYPDPVKYGSYNTRTRTWEIRSAGGYSKQSPEGIARPVTAQWHEIVKDAIQESKTIHESK